MKRILLSILLIVYINPINIACNYLFNESLIDNNFDSLNDTVKVIYTYKIKMSRNDFNVISGYFFPTNKLFDSSWVEYKNTKSASPAIVTSDFNGDKILDYAMLLKQKSKESILFCVFLSNNDKHKLYKIRMFKLNKHTIPYVVNIEKRGNWETAYDKVYKVKNDGVSVFAIDDYIIYTYYYEDEKFVLFQAD